MMSVNGNVIIFIRKSSNTAKEIDVDDRNRDYVDYMI